MQFIHIPASVCPTLWADPGPCSTRLHLKTLKYENYQNKNVLEKRRAEFISRDTHFGREMAIVREAWPKKNVRVPTWRGWADEVPPLLPLPPVPFVPPFILPPDKSYEQKFQKKKTKAKDKELGNEKGKEKETSRKIVRFSNHKRLLRHGDRFKHNKVLGRQWLVLFVVVYASTE